MYSRLCATGVWMCDSYRSLSTSGICHGKCIQSARAQPARVSQQEDYTKLLLWPRLFSNFADVDALVMVDTNVTETMEISSFGTCLQVSIVSKERVDLLEV